MKVLHLISGGDTGGAKTHLLTLLSELKTTEDVLLVCLAPGAMSREAAALGIPCTVLSGGFFREKRAVSALLSAGGYALLHCHGSRANLTGALLKPRLSVPVISTVHSDPRLDYLHRPAAGLIYGSLNQLALRRMDALVCVSSAMKEKLHRRGIPLDRLFTLNNGPDLRTPPTVIDRKAWLAAHGINDTENAVFVGCAARFDRVKDLPTLLRGFAPASEKCPALRLILAGEGREEQALRALAGELGIADRVFFPGWVQDMDGFYGSIHINALPSLSETLPYALSEGARYSLPVVASSVGGILLMTDNGNAGLLFPPGDAAALSRCLLSLAGDKTLREHMGRAFHDHIAAHFSPEAMGRKQRAIYRAVTAPRRGVVISGACGQGNPGDEAMLRAMLEHIRATDEDMPVTVLSRRPGETRRSFGVDAVHSFDLLRLRRALLRSHLLISGGGNLLQDGTSRRSLRYYLLVLRLGQRLGCRGLVFSAGLGPLSPEGLKAAVDTLNRSVHTVVWRDMESKAAAEKAGLTVNAVCAADAALSLPPVPEEAVENARRKFSLPAEGHCILLSLRPWRDSGNKARMLVASASEFARRTDRELVLLPLCRKKDTALARRVAGNCRVLPPPETPEEAMAVIGCGDVLLSMRLHGLVFARSMGIPAAGIACDGRIRSFMSETHAPWQALGQVTDTSAGELLRAALDTSVEEIPRESLSIGFSILEKEVLSYGPTND